MDGVLLWQITEPLRKSLIEAYDVGFVEAPGTGVLGISAETVQAPAFLFVAELEAKAVHTSQQTVLLKFYIYEGLASMFYSQH